MNENLRNQTVKAQEEQQRQAQQADAVKAQAAKIRQEDERRREEERRKAAQTAQRPFDQVEADYRYTMDNLKRENERYETARKAEPEKYGAAKEQQESPAMARYKAHEQTMSTKVEEHLKAGQSQEKAQGHDR